MTKPVSNTCIVQALAKTSPTWCDRISEGSRTDFDKVLTILADPSQVGTRNLFFCDLINRIGRTNFVNNMLTNPLARFKNGDFTMGDTLQEIGVDVLEEYQFEGYQGTKGPAVNQFEEFGSTVEADYHKINRRSMYPLTIQDVRLRTAFTTPNGLSSMISRLLEQLDKSNTADEFIYSKRSFTEFFTNTQRPLLPTQVLKVPDITLDTTAPADLQKFNELVKLRVQAMTFNSRDFNAHKFLTAVMPSDLIIIMRYEYTVRDQTRYLSNIFNPELTKIRVPLIDVDDFDPNNTLDGTKIVGVLCDKRFLQIYNVFSATTTAENARALTTNYFMHIHQLYATSAFMPVVYLVADK